MAGGPAAHRRGGCAESETREMMSCCRQRLVAHLFFVAGGKTHRVAPVPSCTHTVQTDTHTQSRQIHTHTPHHTRLHTHAPKGSGECNHLPLVGPETLLGTRASTRYSGTPMSTVGGCFSFISFSGQPTFLFGPPYLRALARGGGLCDACPPG